jgi:hypothetical protein
MVVICQNLGKQEAIVASAHPSDTLKEGQSKDRIFPYEQRLDLLPCSIPPAPHRL